MKRMTEHDYIIELLEKINRKLDALRRAKAKKKAKKSTKSKHVAH